MSEASSIRRRVALWTSFCLMVAALESVDAQEPAQSWHPVPGMQASISVLQANDPLWYAQDCLGALSLSRAGETGALTRAIADAERLLVMRTSDDWGRKGWSYVKIATPASAKCGVVGAIDAFGDGSCNPPDTPYMIQTGYAVACLARVAQLTRAQKFLEAATAAIEDSWSLGDSNATCPGSFDYRYSYHQNDAGRFVRNTNAIMGVGLISLYEATGNEKYRQRALAIARAEHCEIQAGNLGYFGKADPRYVSATERESRRIENHIPHQVKFLQLAAAKLKEPSALLDARVLLNAYLSCTEPHCRPNNCASWAVPAECRISQSIAPCMDLAEPQWRSACDAARTRFPRLNGFQLYLLEPLTADEATSG